MPETRVMRFRTRRRWTKTDAREALAEQRASGLSIVEFAEKEGFHPERLFRWDRQLSAPAPKDASQSGPQFVEIHRVAAEPVEIVLRSGRVLRVSEDISPAALERLVAVLEAVSC
jgi:transposase-like protein